MPSTSLVLLSLTFSSLMRHQRLSRFFGLRLKRATSDIDGALLAEPFDGCGEGGASELASSRGTLEAVGRRVKESEDRGESTVEED